MHQLLWFSKQQDAVAARDRHTTAIANFSVAFESLQADVRAAEARQEALRADHYAAGDALHDKQGALLRRERGGHAARAAARVRA